MTYYFSYIGDLDDPNFHWDASGDPFPAFNLPRRILPAAELIAFFPPDHPHAAGIAALDPAHRYVLVAAEQ